MSVKGFDHCVIYGTEQLKASSMSILEEMAKLRFISSMKSLQVFKFYFTDMRKCT